MSIPNLQRSEVEDLRNELQRGGRSIDEFDVSAPPRTLDDQSGAISADRGTVTIQNRKTGTTRTYSTGHASSWVADLASDLKLGLLDAEKVFVDAALPATLYHSGKSVPCPTLKEAVLEWMRLTGDDRDEATIRADDGTIYSARQIDCLHHA